MMLCARPTKPRSRGPGSHWQSGRSLFHVTLKRGPFFYVPVPGLWTSAHFLSTAVAAWTCSCSPALVAASAGRSAPAQFRALSRVRGDLLGGPLRHWLLVAGLVFSSGDMPASVAGSALARAHLCFGWQRFRYVGLALPVFPRTQPGTVSAKGATVHHVRRRLQSAVFRFVETVTSGGDPSVLPSAQPPYSFVEPLRSFFIG